jgi:glycosyltransferase involved in cell wall biosynthesis
MIDLLYLSHNRLEFTKASLNTLEDNTDWNLVGQLIICDDNSTDGTAEYLGKWIDDREEMPIVPHFQAFCHPVNAMRTYLLEHSLHSIFAKIDSDTMVPPGWLNTCLKVMDRHTELDLLGIEAFNPINANGVERDYTEARFIGGIGLMRTRAFQNSGLPEAAGRYHGFTEWQERRPWIRKGWLNPSLPVFLLDRLPFEPWRSLSREYVEKFGQRDWGPYDENSKELWSWWKT